MMTVPIFDAAGWLKGFMGGEINLQDKDGLFGDLSLVRVGVSGYLYVIAEDRTMIMHPDVSRVIRKDPTPGKIFCWIGLWRDLRGPARRSIRGGSPSLVSFKRLSTTGWILAANYPMEEVMHPVTRFRNYYLAGMFAILLIGIIEVWRLGTRVTAPLVDLAGQVRDLADRDLENSRLLEHEYPDEVGILADSFNSLLQTVQLREQALKESEERFRQLAEVFPETIFETDMKGIITYTNEHGIAQYGHNSEDYAAGLSVFDVVMPADHEKVRRQVQDSFQGIATGYVDYQARRKDGSTFEAMGLAMPITQNGRPVGVRGFVMDITQRKQAEEALRQSEEKFYKAFQTSLNAIVIIRLDNGTFVEVNDAFVSMTGFIRQELFEISSWGENLWVDKKDAQEVFSILSQGQTVIGRECLFQNRRGEVLTVLLSAQTIQLRSIPCILASMSNITERKRMEEKITHLATHDVLTDLPSLRLGKDRLELALSLASRNKTSVAVMFIDLDGFKSINDSLGHDAGDFVLKQVALRLLSCVRESDTVARIGGDEFLLIATGIHAPGNASQIAEKVISLVSEPMTFNEMHPAISASIGIALYPEDGSEMDDLIKKADNAMYGIKKAGKNGFRFVSAEVKSPGYEL